MNMPTGRQRAGQAVMARRGELGMDRQELAAEAQVDPKTLYNLEMREKWPIAVTRAKIEKALRWQSGELERIRTAADPEPAPELDDDPELMAALRRAYRIDPEKVREAADAVQWAESLPSGEPREAGEFPSRHVG